MTRREWIVAALVMLLMVAAVPAWLLYSEHRIEARARDALSGYLRDPFSAELRNLHETSTGGICGEVNARNGFGAYTGFRQFHASTSGVIIDGDGPVNVLDILCEENDT